MRPALPIHHLAKGDGVNPEPTTKLCECGCGEPAPIADTSSERWKRTKGEPQRFVVGHNLRRGGPPDSPRECACGCGEITTIHKSRARRYISGHHSRRQGLAFFGKWVIDQQSGCHLWTGRLNEHGYGMFGRRLAHRLAWEYEYGSINPSLVIDHLCRVPRCVNVEHLDLVTQIVNMQRGKNAKLDADAVRYIRASSETNAVLARRFGVASTTIRWARNGWTWSNIK